MVDIGLSQLGSGGPREGVIESIYRGYYRNNWSQATLEHLGCIGWGSVYIAYLLFDQFNWMWHVTLSEAVVPCASYRRGFNQLLHNSCLHRLPVQLSYSINYSACYLCNRCAEQLTAILAMSGVFSAVPVCCHVRRLFQSVQLCRRLTCSCSHCICSKLAVPCG